MEDLNPDYLAYRAEGEDDPQRPVELLYVVIRAAVLGLLKSCDMTWRELNKGKVFDVSELSLVLLSHFITQSTQGEDWQAEKCEVSLAEGVQLWAAIKVLEDACRWTLAASQGALCGTSPLLYANHVLVPDVWRRPLHARLLLRKVSTSLLHAKIHLIRSSRPFWSFSQRTVVPKLLDSTTSSRWPTAP